MYKVVPNDKMGSQDTILVDMKNITKWYQRPKWMEMIPKLQSFERTHTLEDDSESTVEENMESHQQSLEDDSSRAEIKKKKSKPINSAFPTLLP